MSRRKYHIHSSILLLMFIAVSACLQEGIACLIVNLNFDVINTIEKILFAYIGITTILYYIDFKQVIDKVISVSTMLCFGLICICLSNYYASYSAQKDVINLLLTDGSSFYKENNIDMPDNVNVINYLPTCSDIITNMMEDSVSYTMLSEVNTNVRLPEYYYNENIREKLDLVTLMETEKDGLSKEDTNRKLAISKLNDFSMLVKDAYNSLINIAYLLLAIFLICFIKIAGNILAGKNNRNLIDEIYNKKYCKPI